MVLFGVVKTTFDPDAFIRSRDRLHAAATKQKISQQTFTVMEMQQTGECPALGQTWLSSNTRGFHGDSVRFKAKLIGVDMVPSAGGDKMCRDSMSKLKHMEAAARKQGKHKQRVWLKVSGGGFKIVDERTGAVQHEHERSKISSLVKDKWDLRALAYIYQEEDIYSLFYVKMAHLAEPVLDKIREIFEKTDEGLPDCCTQISQVSEQTEDSIYLAEPLSSIWSSSVSPPESQQQTKSDCQIFSTFPTQPLEGALSHFHGTMSWGQQGLQQEIHSASPAVPDWTTVTVNMSPSGPGGSQSTVGMRKDKEHPAATITFQPTHLIQISDTLSDLCTAGNTQESHC
uniref:uncharacterized protein LOC131129410 n=1 Tax=Doryrhamphus excisus TaxID=161450 RepID=UPI0025AE92F5|nr:uncharacterized protein LOC131129410 [Doryrhamphus excisus]